MKKFHKSALRGLAVSVSATAMLVGGSAWAQDAEDCERNAQGECIADGISDNDPVVDVADDDMISADGSQSTGDAIVVTGSRLRQDTVSSISPLQILTTEAARDVGEFDAAQILQRSESAAGQQIDATFQGFVLNNGPGSQTLNLRGLGADRTLLLINGRRLAPAGVEGAPSSPSINLIPSSLVARYDLLLDGASSIYGSDAVAGVGNIILRTDIDGIELFASGNINPAGGGDDYTVSAAFGKQFANGHFGIGAEYARRDEVLIGDRDFLRGCNTQYEEDRNGNIYINDVATNAFVQQDSGGTVSTTISPCKLDRITGRIQVLGTFAGSVYYDNQDYGLGVPGNYGIPFFSETTDAFGLPVDANNDGIQDVDLFERTANGQDPTVSFISPEDRYNVMAYGEYSFGGDLNLTPFFEANYSRLESTVTNSGTPQFFPYVPASNQFSPCNFVSNPNGVDCAAAENAYLGGFFNPNVGRLLPVRPIPSIRGDRNNVDSTLEQYRGVLGVRGDMPFIGDTWSFEVSGVYSRSEGSSTRLGIRADRLARSLGIDPTADFDGDGVFDNTGDGIADDYISQTSNPLLSDGVCGTDYANPTFAAPDLESVPCVPVNLFAESLYLPGPVGDFATQAERDYLFGARTFDTTYEQIVASAFVTGDVFTLPAGPVGLVLGGEYRKDKLDSQPDFVASNGLFWGFFADQGAQGSKYLLEAFGEVNVPVFSDDYFGDFEVNLSGRVTDEEFYGTAGTYSIKAGWRPVDQVLLKMSYGTSFRAPNLRENFLAGQSGFGTLFDPCAVPDEAFDGLNGGYDPGNDRRPAFVIANCEREGRNPFTVGLAQGALAPTQFTSTEITSGGSLELDPETSKSFTTGVGVEENFGDFDMSFNINYYSIVVEGAIAEPSAQFIVNECFTRDDGTRSRFCEFISYDSDPATARLISAVFAGFVNRDEEKVKGVDINASFGYDFIAGGENAGVGLNLRANHLIERSTLEIDDDGNPDLQNFEGEFGFPSWTGRAIFSADYGNFGLTWQTRWIGSVAAEELDTDLFVDAFGFLPNGQPADVDGDGFPDVFSDTCLGAGSRDLNQNSPTFGQLDGIVAGDGNYCRDVSSADDYFVHTVSARYEFNDFITLRAGVSNVFDKDPPRIDTARVFGRSNTPLGNGYDLDGREFFGSLSIRF